MAVSPVAYEILCVQLAFWPDDTVELLKDERVLPPESMNECALTYKIKSHKYVLLLSD